MTAPQMDKGGRTVETLLSAFLMSLGIGFVFLVFGVSTGHCSEKVSIAKPSALYLSLAAADYASTRYAIRPGYAEANPLMRSHMEAKQLALAGAFTAADLYFQKKCKRGHVRAIRIAYTAVKVVAVAINVNAARRNR